jgi:hypothetical protein
MELGLVPFREIIRKRRLGFLHYILNESKESVINKVFESQRKNKTSKDWVTTVLKDLKEIDLDLSFEQIEKMKKGLFMNTVKRKTNHKALLYLENLKEKHSKVRFLKHPVLRMQKYLIPNDIKIKKEDCEQIFKIRSRVTQAKVNQKNRYETYECEACEIADESQEHILKCEVILKMQKESEPFKKLEYEKIMNGNVQEQLTIAKLFKKNMEIIENLRKNK